MDSYSFYLQIYNNGNRLGESARVKKVEELIACIYDEFVRRPTLGLEASAFVSKAKAMADLYQTAARQGQQYRNILLDMTQSIYLADAYIITFDLMRYMHSEVLDGKGYRYQYNKWLFGGYGYINNPWEEMDRIYKYLGQIETAVAKLKKRFESSVPKEERAGSEANRQSRQAAVSKSPDPEYGQELTKRSQSRMKENRAHVQAWHEEQAQIMAQIAQMQPSVSKLLEGFISFSDNMTESCTLKFARGLIDLYNLIADSYSYHRKIAEESGNENYLNAVINYEEFCFSIIDCLAPFGVEEISSSPGERFNGKIHDVQNNVNFSARTALVKESLRPGFRYGELILQKEQVRVDNGGGF